MPSTAKIILIINNETKYYEIDIFVFIKMRDQIFLTFTIIQLITFS